MSFKAQKEASSAVQGGAAAALLLFYSAECGLKAALIERLGLRSTSQLPPEFRSHDLQRLAKELRLAPQLCGRMRPCASLKEDKGPVPFGDLHQAWRYGHALKKDHEEQALAVLHELLIWCQRELRA
ncbi:hypothetical protein [Streptosporangium sp. V21-05]|uniref:hypothetical protein n=1 Tax=Streptosporangium sp. V21-05 TaxID=3446115 RepID=UPI003F5378B6